jgi:hypothetical protein
MSTLRPELPSDSNDAAGSSTFDRETSPPQPATNKPSHLGRFKLDQPIGRGAMGEVWRAHDPTRDGPVVIKLLPPELLANAAEAERVRSSFIAVQGLNHQNICPLYDLESDPQLGLYLVMKYIEGVTLAEYWSSVRPRDRLADHAVVAKLLAPVADALDYAHQERVVHRDVKPANILIDRRGEKPFLVDFGLATIIKTSITRISQAKFEVAGTPAFMAPEQFRGRRPNGKADQYALATIAYEMISGGMPFEAHDADTWRHCVLTEPIAPIKGLPRNVMMVLDRAMSKAPQQRFDTCRQFIAALETGIVPRGKRHRLPGKSKPGYRQGLLLATAALTCAAAVAYVFCGGNGLNVPDATSDEPAVASLLDPPPAVVGVHDVTASASPPSRANFQANAGASLPTADTLGTPRPAVGPEPSNAPDLEPTVSSPAAPVEPQSVDPAEAIRALEQVLPATLELARMISLLQDGNYQQAFDELDKAFPGELDQNFAPIFNEAARHVPDWWLAKGQSLADNEQHVVDQLESQLAIAAGRIGTAEAFPQLLAHVREAIGAVNDPTLADEKLRLLLELEELCQGAGQRPLALEILRAALAATNALDTKADWLVARAREKEEFAPQWRAMCEIAARYHRLGESAEASRLLNLALENQRRAEGNRGVLYLACHYYAQAASEADLKLFEAGQHEVISYWNLRTRTEQRAYQLLSPQIATQAWRVGNKELNKTAMVQAESALSNQELWNDRRVTKARQQAVMARLYGAQGDSLMCQSHVNLLNKYVGELRESGDRYGYLPYFQQSLAEATGGLALCFALNGELEEALLQLETTRDVNLSDCRQVYRLWAKANIHNLATLRIQITRLPTSKMQAAAYAGVFQALHDAS